MYKEQILLMDTYILLSFMNMKLRDEFENLDVLCEDYDIEKNEITNKLKSIGYVYNEKTNQFIGL